MNASAFKFSLPVLATKDGTPQRRELTAVYGTAVPIGGDAFLTAGHVIAGITSRADGAEISLGTPGGDGRWTGVRCVHSETVEQFDVGILHARVGDVALLKWRASELAMLEEVWTAGYPHALERDAAVILVRAFRGYVVSERHGSASPPIYEISFHAPRGLSGAPLLHKETGSIGGMILGNRMLKMTVFHEIETLKEGGVTRELRQEEVMHLGIALKANALLDVRVNSLNGTIRNWLDERDLLRPS